MIRNTKRISPCDRYDRLLRKRHTAPLAEAEQRFVEAHRAECADCRTDTGIAELARFDGTDGAAPALDDLSKRRWINEIVDRAQESGAVHEFERQLPDSSSTTGVPFGSRKIIALAAIAAGIPLIVATWLMTTDRNGPESSPEHVSQADLGRDEGAGPTSPHIETKLTAGQVVTTAGGPVVLRLAGGVSVQLAEHTLVNLIRPNHYPAEIELRHGRVVAHVPSDHSGELAFRVLTSAGHVDVTGTVFAVNASDRDIEVQVLEGHVRAIKSDQSEHSISRGRRLSFKRAGVQLMSPQQVATLERESRSLGPIAPGRPPRIVSSDPVQRKSIEPPRPPQSDASASRVATRSTAKSLLKRAGELHRQKNWTAAKRLYNKLIERHPGKPQTGIALTSLAELELGPLNDPQAALHHFSTYLRHYPTGVLAPEATYGKAKALRQLGRRQSERQALIDFVRRYPQALQTQAAKRRLEDLPTTP